MEVKKRKRKKGLKGVPSDGNVKGKDKKIRKS